MRIVFLGTGEFGVPSLRALAEADMAPALVVSQPDRPKGRRKTPTPPPLAAEALALGLPLFQPAKVNRPDVRERIAAVSPDVLVVIAYGQILRPKLLAIPRLGSVNVHGSLLPRHRGASPVQAALLAGDRGTGVTVMLMDEGLDSGPILLQDTIPLNGQETAGALHDVLAERGAPLLVRALQGLRSGELQPVEQDHEGATTCGLMTKTDAQLDWTLPAEQLERRVRAYHPWPGTFTTACVRGKSLRVVVEEACVEPEVRGAPGEVREASGDRIVVAAGSGGLRLLKLKPAGKNAMDAAAFLRGYPLAPDTVLGS